MEAPVKIQKNLVSLFLKVIVHTNQLYVTEGISGEKAMGPPQKECSDPEE